MMQPLGQFRSSLRRRDFLLQATAAASALGSGLFLGGQLFADPTRIAARIEEAPASHPLMPALQLGSESLKALDSVSDYRCQLIKRELIGRKLHESKLELKVRETPFSVYLKFLQPNAGREALYVHGQNSNKLYAHDVGFAGLAGTMSLDPDGSFAMDGNRHPITSIGLRNLVAKTLEQWLDELRMTDLIVSSYPNARVGKVACKAVETSHRSSAQGGKFQLTRLYVDIETGYPVRVQQYDFPQRKGEEAPLAEDYLYTDLAVNVGLADPAFSTKNPKYKF